MENKNYQQELVHIREMMERSSKFLSLSGLSGVFAGIAAVVGGFFMHLELKKVNFYHNLGGSTHLDLATEKRLVVISFIILVAAVFFAYFFTAKKSKRRGEKVWDATTKRLLVNFMVPLVSGGIFCLGLWYQHLFVFTAATTLVFYGLALVSAAKYTLTDVEYLGYFLIFFGLVAVFFPSLGLLLWLLGFGVLHIVYGIIMHKKYQ